MSDRPLELKSHPQAVVLRWPPNWTAVSFFGALGLLHLGIAVAAFWSHRWEAHMSLVFGTLFTAVALICLTTRHEVAIVPQRRRIVLRMRIGLFRWERSLPFSRVENVRVTLLGDQGESTVCIVSPDEDIELPPTRTPRQQALLLAMTMGVRLVKVYADAPAPEPAQRIANLFKNENPNP